MSTTLSKILTYNYIQSYLIKRYIYYASATDVFLGNMKKAVFKNFAILTGKLQAASLLKTYSSTGVFL